MQWPPPFPETCAHYTIVANVVATSILTMACAHTHARARRNVKAWGKQAASDFPMIADGNADLSDSLGTTFDASGGGMGPKRNRRFALVSQGGIITYFGVDKRGVAAASAGQ